jgi:hypothetical protein
VVVDPGIVAVLVYSFATPTKEGSRIHLVSLPMTNSPLPPGHAAWCCSVGIFCHDRYLNKQTLA